MNEMADDFAATASAREVADSMCALCGVLGGTEHWTDAVARPGVFTRNTDPVERRRERARRVRARQSRARRITA